MAAKQFTFLVLIFFSTPSIYSQEHPCGLVDLSPGTYDVPGTYPEWYSGGVNLWETVTFNVIRSTVRPHPHTGYLTALFYPSSGRYVFRTTAAYSRFIVEQNSLIIERTVTFHCKPDEEESTEYHFRLHLLTDDREPEFLESGGHTFTISQDWRPTSTINQGKFVLVKDEDVDDRAAELTFFTEPEGVIEAVGVPLWPTTNPGSASARYHYRVDLYYRPQGEGNRLPPGTHPFTLTAKSGRLLSQPVDITLIVNE